MVDPVVAPEWVVNGEPVLVVSGYRDEQITITSVARVYKRYFTVADHPYARSRFDLHRQTRQGDSGWGSGARVVPVNSPDGQRLFTAARRRELVNAADNATQRWERYRTTETRLAAIAALRAVEDEEK